MKSVLSRRLDDLEPTLTRHGYRIKDLIEQLDARPNEIKALFSDALDPAGAAELRGKMLAGRRFTKWKLRFLDDPKGVYGAAETVDSIGSEGLDKKAPEVAAFLKKFTGNSKDEIGELVLAIRDGAKPEAAAKDWVAKHPERVAEWIKQ